VGQFEPSGESACLAFDSNGSGAIEINEPIREYTAHSGATRKRMAALEFSELINAKERRR